MRMPDGTVIDDNEYHWGAFLAGLGEDDLKEIVLVLEGAEPCILAEAVRWGICNLTDERDEARRIAEDLIDVIKDIQENGAVYDVQSLIDGLLWKR
ncbi:hypothetical protein [Pyramidobacter piscolens]|uniref:hypothetical protein n=1 Tax=Pyramidobacter piscolens TaxID=638849 RepID=UPI003AB27516